MISSPLLVHEKIWLDKPKYDAAERRYYERLAKSSESAKVSNSTNVIEQQDNAGLIEDQDVQANINDSCSMSPSKIQLAKSPKTQDTSIKDEKMEVCSAKQDKPKLGEDAMKHPEESICKIAQRTPDVSPKQAGVLPDGSKQPALTSKTAENDSSCSPQKKLDVGSKTDKPKKSDVPSRDNTKGEVLANTKIETGEITCPKVKGQIKAKVADDKGLKQEFAPDKGSSIDPVSDVVKIDDIAVTSNTVSVEITNRLNSLEKENVELKNKVSELVELLKKMDIRISSLEKTCAGGSKPAETKAPAPVPHVKKDDAEDDDGVDLFGSDSEEEDTEAAKIKEQRLAEYAARKAKKPVLIAKSNIILDVKPWDDETNMKELEAEVRKITTDGLVWGASKLVPLAYGIHKLQISCVVEDDKVSVDWLQETIQEIEDYVQSVDIAAFNKV